MHTTFVRVLSCVRANFAQKFECKFCSSRVHDALAFEKKRRPTQLRVIAGRKKLWEKTYASSRHTPHYGVQFRAVPQLSYTIESWAHSWHYHVETNIGTNEMNTQNILWILRRHRHTSWHTTIFHGAQLLSAKLFAVLWTFAYFDTRVHRPTVGPVPVGLIKYLQVHVCSLRTIYAPMCRPQ